MRRRSELILIFVNESTTERAGDEEDCKQTSAVAR